MVILKIYGFRLGELVSDSNTITVDGTPLASFGLDIDGREVNLLLLGVFGLTLLFTLFFHFGRLARVLLWKKQAFILTFFIMVKCLLLVFDLLANGFVSGSNTL
jgi:hypothetical protein